MGSPSTRRANGVLRVLSLGAGVQSSTCLLMSLAGELPRLDAAVFADTGWEPKAVYAHLDRLEATATAGGIPVYRVSAGNLRAPTRWTRPATSPACRCMCAAPTAAVG
jgi:hypothetical protein